MEELSNDLTSIRLAIASREQTKLNGEYSRMHDLQETLKFHTATIERMSMGVKLEHEGLLMKNVSPEEMRRLVLSYKNHCERVVGLYIRRVEEYENECRACDSAYIRSIKDIERDWVSLSRRIEDNIYKFREKLDSDLNELESSLVSRRTDFHLKMRAMIDESLDPIREFEVVTRFSKILSSAEESSSVVHSRRIALLGEEQQYLGGELRKLDLVLESREKSHVSQILERKKIQFEIERVKNQLLEESTHHAGNAARAQLVKLRTRHHDLSLEFDRLSLHKRNVLQRLRAEVLELQSRYSTMLEKSFHFESVNEEKFARVFKSNELELNQFIDRIKRGISGVYKKNLNIDWDPNMEEDSSGRQIGDNGSENALSVAPPKSIISATTSSGDSSKQVSKFSLDKIKTVVDLVMDGCPYLGGGVTNPSPPPLPVVVSVLSYLGVESLVELDLLVHTFTEGQEEEDNSVFVSSESEVMDLVKAFVAANEDRRIADIASGKAARIAAKQSGGNKLEKIRAEEKKFWAKLGNSVSKTTENDMHVVEEKLKQKLEVLVKYQRCVELFKQVKASHELVQRKLMQQT